MYRDKLKTTMFALAVMLVHSSFVSAEADSYIGANYQNIDGDITGWSVGWTLVDEKYRSAVGYARYEGEVNVTGGIIDYGFGNLKEGSVYIGLQYSNASAFGESVSDTSINIGYSKSNPNEISWNVYINDGDGDAMIGAGIRVPMSEQLGIGFGFRTQDSINAYNIGVSFNF